MLGIMLFYFTIALVTIAWAMDKKTGLILFHIIGVAWVLFIMHGYGETQYLRGVYTATHLNHYPLEKK